MQDKNLFGIFLDKYYIISLIFVFKGQKVKSLKYLCVLLSCLLVNSVVPMQQSKSEYVDVGQKSLSLLDLPEEIIMYIIKQAIIQQVKEDLSKWNTIFEKPKINLEDLKGFYATSHEINNFFKSALESTDLKNHIEELKEERFKELCKSLEDIAQEEYKGLTIDELNSTLSEILKKYDLSKIDYEKICKLALLGANINIIANGVTPLTCLSRQGNRDVVKLLIKLGADVNLKDKHGETALMVASYYGHKEIVQMLIKVGADVNARSNHGDTALIYASRYGYKDIAELLINMGVDINTGGINGSPALIEASWTGYKEIVELLVNSGVNINAQDDRGVTALIRAAEFGRKEIVELLIRSGANINIRDTFGRTALIMVSMRNNTDINNTEIINTLLKAGANTNYRDNLGKNYLYYRTGRYQQEKMLRLITIELPTILTGLFILWVLNKDQKKEEQNTDKNDKQENENIEVKNIDSSNEQIKESICFP